MPVDIHPAPMITILYASRAVGPLDGIGLSEILQVSRSRNASVQVTGMLLYAYGGFVQQLEGEAAAVEAIYTSIATDPRHAELRLLSRRPISGRRYGDWAMGAEHPFVEASGGHLLDVRSDRQLPLVNHRLIRNREAAENLLLLFAARQHRAAAAGAAAG